MQYPVSEVTLHCWLKDNFQSWFKTEMLCAQKNFIYELIFGHLSELGNVIQEINSQENY